MKIKIEFDLDNAAYKNEDESLNTDAVANELNMIAIDVRNGYAGNCVQCISGNTIGRWSIDDE